MISQSYDLKLRATDIYKCPRANSLNLWNVWRRCLYFYCVSISFSGWLNSNYLQLHCIHFSQSVFWWRELTSHLAAWLKLNPPTHTHPHHLTHNDLVSPGWFVDKACCVCIYLLATQYFYCTKPFTLTLGNLYSNTHSHPGIRACAHKIKNKHTAHANC